MLTFIFALVLYAGCYTLVEESHHLLQLLDEFDIIFASLLALLVYAATRNRKTIEDLRKGNAILTIIAFVTIALTIYGIIREPRDFQDYTIELPSLLLIVGIVRNGKKDGDESSNRELGHLQSARNHLHDLPLWALNADYDFFKRKLEIAKTRKQNGEPAHKKYDATYERNLEHKIALIDEEIARRKEESSSSRALSQNE